MLHSFSNIYVAGFNVKTWTLNNKAEVDLYSDMDVDTFILGFDDVPQ